MNNGILLIWLIILLFSFLRRAANRGKRTGGMAAGVPQGRTVSVPQDAPVNKKPIRVSQEMTQPQGARERMAKRFGKPQPEGTGAGLYGQVPREQGAGTMRFTGRPDLEPGYMYLNGVKVLIKEADRLEFLK